MIDWNILIKLINVFIWPVIVITALLLYHKPLSKFIGSIGSRLTKLSAFNISIELAALSEPASPWTDKTIPDGSQMIGGEVSSTSLMMLFEQVGIEKPMDYLIVDIKDGRFWFTSRLFIFSTFLEAIRGLKCIVFVQSHKEYHQRLIGLASPKILCKALIDAHPWFEIALQNALNKCPINNIGSALSSSDAGNIIQAFIEDDKMRLRSDPAELIKDAKNQTLVPGEWLRLGKSETWEHTYWLDFDNSIVSSVITGSFYENDTSHYFQAFGTSNEELIRELLLRKSPFIALVNSKNEFKSLIERQKLAALVGEELIK